MVQLRRLMQKQAGPDLAVEMAMPAVSEPSPAKLPAFVPPAAG